MANVKMSDRALEFELPGVDGRTYALAQVSEGKKATVVVFMCNHCPYVLAWMDRLVSLAEAYANQGVAFIGINSNDPTKYAVDDFEGMQRLAQEQGLPFPYVQDATQEVATAYGAERTPEFFLFDADSRLKYHGALDDSHDETQAQATYLRDALDAILAGHEPPTEKTPPVGCTIKWK
ncbi:thioredoxin family protein [Chloroflexota bacterium]